VISGDIFHTKKIDIGAADGCLQMVLYVKVQNKEWNGNWLKIDLEII